MGNAAAVLSNKNNSNGESVKYWIVLMRLFIFYQWQWDPGAEIMFLSPSCPIFCKFLIFVKGLIQNLVDIFVDVNNDIYKVPMCSHYMSLANI